MINLSEKKLRLTMALRSQAILSSPILSAIETIPREKFIGSALRHHAYENASLPIACGQTISQPYIVAKMTEASGTFDKFMVNQLSEETKRPNTKE